MSIDAANVVAREDGMSQCSADFVASDDRRSVDVIASDGRTSRGAVDEMEVDAAQPMRASAVAS